MSSSRARPTPAAERAIRLAAQGVLLDADLAIPEKAAGLVVFAHGSGSSRKSPRNRAVAAALQECGLATLLVDLLAREEEAFDARTARLRFDIPLLAGRLTAVTDTTAADEELRSLPLGYFGASTGGAAALTAAAARPASVAAIVVRGGRPDLAGASLSRVRASTLFIVGGLDREVLALNRAAASEMRAIRELVVIDGATHLFPEPGALEEVARLAADWFVRCFGAAREGKAAGSEPG